MKQIVGIQLGKQGRVVPCQYVDEHNTEELLHQGVMAELEQGTFFGRVVWQRPMLDEEIQQYLESAQFQELGLDDDGGQDKPKGRQQQPRENKPNVLCVVRRATAEEEARALDNHVLCCEAKSFCQECVNRLELDMKLVDVEMLHDRSKMLFYFTAPTRIDFRELVKELVRKYRTRIELRQIGVRHETQMVGALGNCGMVCCCRRYLRRFAPVTIKMAKEQNLFLNPAKISGICGRLLCCLSFEQDNYDAFHHSCPKLGKRYQTTQGMMRVLRGNMFRNSIVVLPDGGQEMEISLDEWQALQPHRSENPNPQPQKAKPCQQSMLVVSAAPESLDTDLDQQYAQDTDPE